jgi:hypothetical protein
MPSIDPFKLMPWFFIEELQIVSAANWENLHFILQSKVLKEFDALELVSKGFLDEITIQDFPRGVLFLFAH